MTTIDLIYFNAGGGHRAAARALEAVIREQARPWQVRLVNLFEVLDPQEIFRRTAGFKPEDFYNTRLAYGWTIGLEQELKLLQALIRLGRDALTLRLRRHWQKTRPDMVVSLVPNFNRVMCRALAEAVPAAPFVVILTDFADHPPHFWIEPRQKQHLICGTQRSALQARAAAQDKSTIHQTSGMIISPDFYRALDIDRAHELRSLGLDPGKPTGLVLFGGHGSKVMQSIAARLEDTQLILICGHNAELAERLSAMPATAPRHVVGFTSKVRYYMAVSDFFIGKPGPGSISEALQQRLPVILVRNAWTMPQERYNTEWVLENEVGLVLKSFKTINSAVIEMKGRLAEFRRRVERISNRAVFEIPDIFERILREAAFGRDARSATSHRRIVGQSAEIELS
jgi:UDP-N-acetylglucosamine:LPS N-acetylglucosamine transferase